MIFREPADCPKDVPLVIEAYHRASMPEAAVLWPIIDKMWELQPIFSRAIKRPDIVAVARLIKRAWRQREKYLREQSQPFVRPSSVDAVDETLSVPPLAPVPDSIVLQDELGMGNLQDPSPEGLDLIDWSIWDTEKWFQSGFET